MSTTTLDDVIRLHGDVLSGGHWSPPDCLPRQKIALIIPFRDRNTHLPTFLRHMVSIFKRQKLEFRIIVVEQVNNIELIHIHRSKLNIGAYIIGTQLNL